MEGNIQFEENNDPTQNKQPATAVAEARRKMYIKQLIVIIFATIGIIASLSFVVQSLDISADNQSRIEEYRTIDQSNSAIKK